MRCLRSSLLGVVAIAIILPVAWGCGGVTAPTSYETFNARDGIVQFQYPTGWKQKGGAAKEFRFCSFQSGPAKIRVMATITPSVMGDIANTGGGMMGLDGAAGAEIDDDLTPIAAVHEADSIPKTTEDLGELDVKSTETIETGFGDTRISEFTVEASLGSNTHGYVVTALTKDKGIRMTCTCPEKHWETLKPAFDKVIESMGRGQSE